MHKMLIKDGELYRVVSEDKELFRLGDILCHEDLSYKISRMLIDNSWYCALIGTDGNAWAEGIKKPKMDAFCFSLNDIRAMIGNSSIDEWRFPYDR